MESNPQTPPAGFSPERSLDTLLAFIDHSPAVAFLKDAEGRLLYVNRIFEQTFQQPAIQLLGKTDAELWPAEVAAQLHANDLRVLTTGQPLQIIEHVPTPDGQLHTWLSFKFRVTAEHGEPYVGGMAVDITAQEDAQRKIRESETRYRQLVEQLPAITYMAEFGSGRWLYCSPQIESLLGFSVAEWTGERGLWLEQVHPDDRAQVLAAESQARNSGKEFFAEYRMRARDGRIVWFSDRAVVVTGADGRPQYLHGVMFDVTERKALEEKLAQAQKMDAIGRLAGGVAHDFNNILTAILGYSELILRRADGNDRIRDHAREIQKAAERAASLTRQLLAFSRKQTMQPRLLDLNTVVAEMDQMLRRLITESIQIRVRLDPVLWRTRADPGQIQQVILNLAVNARDAMPAGGTLTIETANAVLDERYARQHADATAGDHVMLVIRDTGCGLSAEAVEHLFEPFFTTKGLGQGTGLGLATCYGIVRQSGGHISVDTEPGRGTTFKVYLPRAAEAGRAPVALLPPVGTPRGRERVLVVEDESPVRELSSAVLRELGYQVVEARDGEEALRLTKQAGAHAFDLLFTDMVMPKMGGKELAHWFRLTHPNTRVLFTSGYPEKAGPNDGELVAGIAFLHKPYTPDSLARKVREVLDN